MNISKPVENQIFLKNYLRIFFKAFLLIKKKINLKLYIELMRMYSNNIDQEKYYF